jgi:hypothetical protein
MVGHRGRPVNRFLRLHVAALPAGSDLSELRARGDRPGARHRPAGYMREKNGGHTRLM